MIRISRCFILFRQTEKNTFQCDSLNLKLFTGGSTSKEFYSCYATGTKKQRFFTQQRDLPVHLAKKL